MSTGREIMEAVTLQEAVNLASLWGKFAAAMEKRLREDWAKATGRKVKGVEIQTIRTSRGDLYSFETVRPPVFEINGWIELDGQPEEKDWEGKLMKMGWVNQEISGGNIKLYWYFSLDAPQR